MSEPTTAKIRSSHRGYLPTKYGELLIMNRCVLLFGQVGALSSRSLAVYHPLRKRTGVCSLTKSEHRPSSDPDSTSTRPRLDLDPDMTRPDPDRDPKSSTLTGHFDLDPQISPRPGSEPSSSLETPNLARDSVIILTCHLLHYDCMTRTHDHH